MLSIKKIQLLLGPLLGALIYFGIELDASNPLVSKMAAVVVWMSIWWFTEVVHLAVTSLLPVVLLPILGIVDSKTTAVQYMDPIIFLFIGGFIIAFAIERWHLHQRIALKILTIVGTSPSRILFGIMLTSYLISMWISNTATVMMLLSAVLAIIVQIENHYSHKIYAKKMATALLIGLAYSATIGGMATLVGTPTNMIFYREYTERFPLNNDVNFFSWFIIGFPVSIVLLLFAYWVLKVIFLNNDTTLNIENDYFEAAYKRLGKMNYEEKVVGILFAITAIAWFTRADIDFGRLSLKGWSNLFPQKNYLNDSTVAIFMALLLFLIPSKAEKGRPIVVWEDIKKLPFDIILLFGGGFAMAKGFEVSGLSSWIASNISFSNQTNIYLATFVLCVIITVISEFASNVACIQLMLPVLVAIQIKMNIHPLILMLPATLASSLGFMLPVATAPNTIVFGSNRLRVKDMIRVGLILDIIGVLIITSATFLILKVF